ncbi:hypothetical protein GCM10009610_72650 [Pseudonocardia xinjiangensis]
MHGRASDQSRQTRTGHWSGSTTLHAANRGHTALGGQPPISRVNNPPGHYT